MRISDWSSDVCSSDLNPVHHLVRMLHAVTAEPLDQGTAHFQPSTLQISTADVGNPATNVIPAVARAVFNIRFNDLHTGASLESWLRRKFDAAHEIGRASCRERVCQYV